ncbi:TBC1 domain family member 20 isoform X3 [Onthophagus taurus]|nr:TBC1 domain family member 20 isoform X2 [Onthophagus taurus]XP_022914126.1 TBC1 domain family member 20 isoform X3 [Onthophagus taurus]
MEENSEFEQIEADSLMNNIGHSIDDQEKDMDTRSELKFDEYKESEEETVKRREIEKALQTNSFSLNVWKKFAVQKHGLINDELRRKIWPLLLEVDTDLTEVVPSLEELSTHKEYDQVVLDVNRSLKRFPPGIPYKQRLALQDQLTILILRVIMKYPDLRYYQGYHDVAITFLLVVGEVVAFRIMEVLSTEHLRECMEPTMEKTSYRLNYIYAMIQNADKQLHDYMDRAGVGTMFALPWFLTWFGHSLNQYKDVVRLYDFFLASPPLMPLYVAAALVIYRRKEILYEPCDMASIHCLLSQIPDNLDFEQILISAAKYYKSYPPERLEKDVKKRIQRELDQRKKEERLRNARNRKPNDNWIRIHNYVPHWLMLHYRNKYGILFATATVLIGIYAYLKATEKDFSLFK